MMRQGAGTGYGRRDKKRADPGIPAVTLRLTRVHPPKPRLRQLVGFSGSLAHLRRLVTRLAAEMVYAAIAFPGSSKVQ